MANRINHLRARVDLLCIELGITHTQLYQRLGISRPRLYKILATKTPRPRTLDRLASVLRCTVDQLLAPVSALEYGEHTIPRY